MDTWTGTNKEEGKGLTLLSFSLDVRDKETLMFYMKIAIDFDGTVVAHRYPSIGKDIGAVPVLKELTEKGHKLILNTMRCKNELEAAKEWFKENGVPLYSANHCPGQHTWTSSPKVFADLYIDDMSLGCPLIEDPEEPKPYVDWTEVRRLLQEGGVL